MRVIKPFRDKTDNLKGYSIGDSYNHSDDERIAFLVEKGFLEAQNKQPPDIKHVGGGYYELPNGEKVRGKEEALKSLAESGE